VDVSETNRPAVDQVSSTSVDQTVGSIGAQAGRGLRWNITGNLILRIGSLAMGLVLARLLAPADFGVYAVALAVLNFVMHVNDVGVIAATVQWRGRIEEMAPTGATVALFGSLGVYALFWFTAPLLAALANAPAAVVPIRLLIVIIIIDGITSVRAGALLRRFEQDKVAKANLVGFVVNAILAISLAVMGAGALSFIGGQVAGACVAGVMVFAYARLPVRLGFDREVARRLARFGLPLAASLGVEAVLLNADYIIVGNQVGVAAVGIYLLAFNLSSWLQGLVGSAIRNVTMPSFSRLAEQDGALSAGVQRSLPLLISLVLPVAIVMSIFAEDLVGVLYGKRWLPAAPVLQFLVVLMIVRLLVSYSLDVLMSAGLTGRTLWLNLGWLVALMPALVIGTMWGGIRGTAIAHAAVAVTVAAPLAGVLLARAGVRLAPMIHALGRPFLGAVLAIVSGVLINSTTDFWPIVTLGVGGLSCLLVYLAVVVPVATMRRFTAGRSIRASAVAKERAA